MTQADATDAPTASDIPTNPTPRMRTVAGKARGTITRLGSGALAPDKPGKGTGKGKRTGTKTTVKTVKTGTKRAPYGSRRKTTAGLIGSMQGNQGALLSSLLSQNGFTDAAKINVTEGRKVLSLPLGLFTGK